MKTRYDLKFCLTHTPRCFQVKATKIRRPVESSTRTFVDPNICQPEHLSTQTFVGPNIHRPKHLSTQTFVDPNICWPEHSSTQTFVNPNIRQPKHSSTQTFVNPNICWPEHLSTQTFVNPNIRRPSTLVLILLSLIKPNLTRVKNQAFGYYLMPATGSLVHLLPEPAGSGSGSTNIWVDEFINWKCVYVGTYIYQCLCPA
jgi:hypothetical protein